jgi:serralysin
MPGTLGCGCPSCAAGPQRREHAGEGLDGLPGTKPVWSLPQIVDALTRWDARWPGEVLYSFYGTTPAHLAGESDWNGFVSFSPEQRAAARDVFAMIAEIANITFREVPDDGSWPGAANPRFTFSTSLSTPQYFTAYAAVDWSKGLDLGDRHAFHTAELMFNAHRWDDVTLGLRPYAVLIHEIMHGLGVPHPGEYNRTADEPITYAQHADYAQDSTQFTLMSYFGAATTGANHAGTYGQTPLLHDIAALQALHGPNMNTRAGDTVYGYDSNAGRTAYDFGLNLRPVLAIWDGGGVDTLNFSGTWQAVRADLGEGMFSDAFGMTNNISIGFGTVIENAIGGSAGDLLRGNAVANALLGAGGNDQLEGGGGDDVLTGGAGDDQLAGGVGWDTASYADASAGLTLDMRSGVIVSWMGTDTLDGVEHLVGTRFSDLMIGDTGSNRLDGGLGDDLLRGGLGDDVLVGGAGWDVADYSDATTGLTIDLGSAAQVTWMGTDTLQDIEIVRGSRYNDFLVGSAGVNWLDAGEGDDILLGNAGSDTLTGGWGADRFVFRAAADSSGGARDIITDFDRSSDLIDLSQIDADVHAAGDQGFTFGWSFTGQAGQAVLTYDPGSNLSTFQADVDGDGAADFVLTIAGDAGTGWGWLL